MVVILTVNGVAKSLQDYQVNKPGEKLENSSLVHSALQICLDWSDKDRQKLATQLGSALVRLTQLCDACATDLPKAAVDKMEKNRKKYPADKFYGCSRKYNE